MKHALAAFALCGMLAAPASAEQPATFQYNFVNHELEFYDGSDWYNLSLGLTAGACSKEGAMDYNNLLSLYQYCNGSHWVKIIGVPTLSFCSKEGAIDYRNNTYMYCNGLVWSDMKGLALLAGM